MVVRYCNNKNLGPLLFFLNSSLCAIEYCKSLKKLRAESRWVRILDLFLFLVAFVARWGPLWPPPAATRRSAFGCDWSDFIILKFLLAFWQYDSTMASYTWDILRCDLLSTRSSYQIEQDYSWVYEVFVWFHSFLMSIPRAESCRVRIRKMGVH